MESEQDPERNIVRSARSVMPYTPFSVLAAQQSTSDVARVQSADHQQFGTAADVAVRKVILFLYFLLAILSSFFYLKKVSSIVILRQVSKVNGYIMNKVSVQK